MPPNIQFTFWDNNETSPIGLRHLDIAPAFIRHLSSGSTSGLFDFGDMYTSPSGEQTRVFTMRVLGSGLITNMRLWLNQSGMLAGLNAPWIVGFVNSGTWIKNYNPDQSTIKKISGVVPTAQNIFRQDGNQYVGSGIVDMPSAYNKIGYGDDDVSQFIFVKLFLDPNAKVGSFNMSASGALQFRTTFDFVNL